MSDERLGQIIEKYRKSEDRVVSDLDYVLSLYVQLHSLVYIVRVSMKAGLPLDDPDLARAVALIDRALERFPAANAFAEPPK